MRVLSSSIYGKFAPRIVRAILERLDRLLADQVVVWNGLKTVEHILPQSPQDGSWTQFSTENREIITNTIGNLVLLTSRKNSSCSNSEFIEKKDIYFGLGNKARKKIATYASVQELAHLNSWDMDAYRARQERHVELLAQRWYIQ